jgi:hypothetical protein
MDMVIKLTCFTMQSPLRFCFRGGKCGYGKLSKKRKNKSEENLIHANNSRNFIQKFPSYI